VLSAIFTTFWNSVKMPAPSAKRPLGSLALARLPLTVELRIVSAPSKAT
jgi:hypothetical protein